MQQALASSRAGVFWVCLLFVACGPRGIPGIGVKPERKTQDRAVSDLGFVDQTRVLVVGIVRVCGLIEGGFGWIWTWDVTRNPGSP